jgi:hypothetical protein
LRYLSKPSLDRSRSATIHRRGTPALTKNERQDYEDDNY